MLCAAATGSSHVAMKAKVTFLPNPDFYNRLTTPILLTILSYFFSLTSALCVTGGSPWLLEQGRQPIIKKKKKKANLMRYCEHKGSSVVAETEPHFARQDSSWGNLQFLSSTGIVMGFNVLGVRKKKVSKPSFYFHTGVFKPAALAKMFLTATRPGPGGSKQRKRGVLPGC